MVMYLYEPYLTLIHTRVYANEKNQGTVTTCTVDDDFQRHELSWGCQLSSRTRPSQSAVHVSDDAISDWYLVVVSLAY